MRALTILAATAFSTPALASYDRLLITQNGPSDFTVGYEGGASINNHWCAAGRHLTNTLGLPGSTRVYRQSPPPRQSGQGISFCLDAARSSRQGRVSDLWRCLRRRRDGQRGAGAVLQRAPGVGHLSLAHDPARTKP